ncbi:LuxR C-terminal-related transcriptional regulator, partial [Alphaproteobacteria bacterium]|nr:LuxR C-terminal-related transcriptional regulator [Alphaproteobacteria bacterium]
QMSWAGFDLRSIRQWREKTFSYQHGLSIERHWADQMTGQLFRLQGGIAGRIQHEIEWQMGEIARSLNLSEVTIKHHLKSLRSKLGAKNRTHAVCRAIELGIS